MGNLGALCWNSLVPGVAGRSAGALVRFWWLPGRWVRAARRPRKEGTACRRGLLFCRGHAGFGCLFLSHNNNKQLPRFLVSHPKAGREFGPTSRMPQPLSCLSAATLVVRPNMPPKRYRRIDNTHHHAVCGIFSSFYDRCVAQQLNGHIPRRQHMPYSSKLAGINNEYTRLGHVAAVYW
ncbi:hypothetical protein GGTG_13574 [Gaeumannomyces tritici R3-111a-1]|uniref:Secreted protein n=1 Tax=Gaeumannomyces tritici (strain R3-111a-1) TaxID=644352 RepID=J3PJ93_GAET3|nr:hypothetical protein GGTG_13574 [Gaeumannomyces tritici R3-111a-1]EJT68865.1 hypothetical protein GGTG_13574 [Gaeumannomyces tritici R3-111a-1]